MRTLSQEVEQLVLEQIRSFGQPANMNDGDIFEFHLRHYQIMALYRERDRVARAEGAPKPRRLTLRAGQ